jgi:hypothetical protein
VAVGGRPAKFLEKKSSRRFQKKIPYHGMMPHDLVFRPTSPAALDESLETPWRLFVLRPLFCRLGFEKGRRKNFRAKTLAPISQTFFPYHGMMPHDLVFRPTSYVALDDSLETPWRLFVLRPLFLQLGQNFFPPEGIHIFTLYA